MTSSASGKWCMSFVGIVLFITCAIAAANYSMDIYGLFRDVKGNKIKIYGNDRPWKFLLSYRYIPANFDGILIGSSLSETWDVSRIEGARVYNASISGGNISEEKLIADNVFSQGKMKLVIFCIHPYLTASHGRKTGYMNKREYWGALGSIELPRVYAKLIGARLGLLTAKVDENGMSREFGPVVVPQKSGEDSTATKNHTAFKVAVDEIAFTEYKQLVQNARAQGAKVVAFIPPIYEGVYAAQKTKYDTYFARVSALFQPNEKVINFNLPIYASYTREPTNFYDGAHLTAKAADYFSAELASEVRMQANTSRSTE